MDVQFYVIPFVTEKLLEGPGALKYFFIQLPNF